MKYQDIIAACHAKSESAELLERNVSTISIDTRTLQPGDVYVAIEGAQHDGHDFVPLAKEKGALAAVVSKKIDCDIPQIVVPDTTKALGEIAAYWRQQFSIPIIAITGSVGKSTVRNMVTCILQKAVGKKNVLVPEKNFNNHWGLPLVLSRLNAQHQFAVLEMGMNHLEEIRYLMKIAQPTIGVITNAGTNHIGLLGSIENIAKAKGEMFEELPKNSVAIINKDDRFYDYWLALCHAKKERNIKVMTFGLTSNEVTAKNIRADFFTLVTPIGEIDVQRTLLGEHNIRNALAATAAVLAAGIHDLQVIKQGIEVALPEPGRLQKIVSSSGVIILNDSYNSGETSTQAALHVLSGYAVSSRKFAVLGDMSEVIDPEVTHQRVGKQLSSFSLDEFIAFGVMMQHAYASYSGIEKKHFLIHNDVVNYLKSLLQPGDVVLVKGSRVMKMEKIVDALRLS